MAVKLKRRRYHKKVHTVELIPIGIGPVRDGFCHACGAIRLSREDRGGKCMYCRYDEEAARRRAEQFSKVKNFV